MPELPAPLTRKPSVARNLVRILLICLGCIALLFPAWLPNRPGAPIERGTVELLQPFLLLTSAAILLGASTHAGAYRPVCRVMSLGMIAAFIGEIEDFIYQILNLRFPAVWVISILLLIALITALRHRRVMVHFLATLGNHAGTGLIGSALLIIYVFNRVIGSQKFWKAALGAEFSPAIPRICKGYLELLACYLIFIGALGLSITLARRKEPT
jgi:uncharacterized membrane protein